MKKVKTVLVLFAAISLSVTAQVKVLSTKGITQVRYGVSEEWKQLNAGTQLSLADAVQTFSKSYITLQINNHKITINEKTIIEIADLRHISREELLMKLAMERILSVPPQDRNDDLMPARTTIIHGEKKIISQSPVSTENVSMQLNGVKFLYENNFFGTCAIRVKEIFRINQNLNDFIDYKILAANSLEKLDLWEEALHEFNSLQFDKLTQQQKIFVQQSIDRLKIKISD